MIAFFGDSTQAGISVWSGTAHQEEYTPAKVAGALLGSCVENYGIGGSTLSEAVSGALDVEAKLAATSAEIVVANWGINDAFLPGNTGYDHRQRWKALRDVVAASGKRLVIQTPNPITGNHGPILANLVAASRGIDGVSYVDVHAKITWFYPEWAAHLSDGIHPNSIMYHFIGAELARGLAE